MIYIFTATKSEAQAIVEKYKLKKQKKYSLQVFYNQDIEVIISGIGIENTQKSLTLFQKFSTYTPQDTLLNIGIAGAPQEFFIGQLLKINHVIYDTDKITLSFGNIILRTVKQPIFTQQTT